MALWWLLLAAGTLLLVLSGVVAVTRAFSGRRVPRLGFFPPRRTDASWWASAGLAVGIFLMALSAGQLSETSAGYFTYFGGAAAVALLVQSVLVSWHNRRLAPESDQDAMSKATPGIEVWRLTN
jgi:hypothetical protein